MRRVVACEDHPAYVEHPDEQEDEDRHDQRELDQCLPTVVMLWDAHREATDTRPRRATR